VITISTKIATGSILSDVPDIVPFATTSNDYADVFIWDTHFLATKKLTFSATTHDLYVKILGSADGGASFSETEVSDVSITTASPVTIQVDEYYYALKVQVKPATANQHGTITVKAMGVSIPSSATSTLDTIDSKLPPLVNGKVPVDASVSVDAIDIGNVDISEFPARKSWTKTKSIIIICGSCY